MLYGGTEVLALLCRALLLSMGCRLGALETERAGSMMVAVAGIEDWQQQQQQQQKEKQQGGKGAEGSLPGGGVAGGTVPVMLLHGVGLGLLPYLNLLR